MEKETENIEKEERYLLMYQDIRRSFTRQELRELRGKIQDILNTIGEKQIKEMDKKL